MARRSCASSTGNSAGRRASVRHWRPGGRLRNDHRLAVMSQSSGGRRRRLVWARRPLASSRRRWEPRVGRVGRRGVATTRPPASRARRRSRARFRLRAWDRSSDATARTSGPKRSSRRWRWPGRSEGDRATSKTTSTRVSEVLACWPPGPPLRLKRQRSSARGTEHSRLTRRRSSRASSPIASTS